MKKKKLPVWKQIFIFLLDAGIIIGIIIVIGDLLEKIWAWCQLDMVEIGSEEAAVLQEAMANGMSLGGYAAWIVFILIAVLIHKLMKVPLL